MCRAVLGIPGQQCTGRRPRTTDVTGESLTVDLRAVGATEEPRAEETPGQTSLKENTGREGREASEGRLRPGDREAGRLGGREAGRLGGWQVAANPGPPEAGDKGPVRDRRGKGSVSAHPPCPALPSWSG